jgi:tetratricopeptide (TPR) repeat protein
VILQLFDPEIDDMIWESTYIRKYGDIFNVQSEIALDVVSALDIVISGKAREAIEDLPTENQEAWDLYLRGRYYHLQYAKFRGMADIDFALDFYQRAFDVDPNFALALSRRAEALDFKHWFEFRDRPALKDSFFNLANRALQIDSNRAEVYLPFASYHLFQEQDYRSAIHYYKRAIELDPRNQDLFANMAFACSRWSNFSAENKHYNDSALIYAKHALELQPGESYEQMLYTIADSYQNYGMLDVAEKFIDASLEYAPDYLDALNKKFYLRAFQLDFDAAHSIAERSDELVRDNQGLYLLAKILHFKDEYAEAEKYYKRFYSLPPEIHSQQQHERTSYAQVLLKNEKPREAAEEVEVAANWMLKDGEYDWAKVLLLRGDLNEALSQLEEFEPWFGLDHWIAYDPVFDSVHDEPRFQTVVERCKEWSREKRLHVEKGIAEGIFPHPENL